MLTTTASGGRIRRAGAAIGGFALAARIIGYFKTVTVLDRRRPA